VGFGGILGLKIVRILGVKGTHKKVGDWHDFSCFNDFVGTPKKVGDLSYF
jgi:hypothetical protein